MFVGYGVIILLTSWGLTVSSVGGLYRGSPLILAAGICNTRPSTVEDSFSLSKKVWSILKRLAILGNFGGQTKEEKL